MMTSPGCRSPAKNSAANRTGSVEESMNCGIPTDRAASLPVASRMVALRSFDWFRIGVVAGEVSATAPSYTAECVAAQQAHVTALFIADIAEVIANVAKDCSTQGYHPIYVIDGLSVAPSFATTPGLEDNLTGPSDDIPFYASTPEVKAMTPRWTSTIPGCGRTPASPRRSPTPGRRGCCSRQPPRQAASAPTGPPPRRRS
jgi:hypothetical protein